MNKLFNAFLNMNDLDDFSMGDTYIHRLHPMIKMITALLMIVFVLSTYQISELCIYLLIVFAIGHLAHLSNQKLMKRGLLGLPLSLCLSISFLLFYHQKVNLYGVMVDEGMILSLIILLKTFLCLIIGYLLIATTSFHDLASELVYLKVPSIFILVLIMTYRYIFTFLLEAQTMSKAYILRNPYTKAIEWKDIGSFIGHLLICSMNQSQYIYHAMKCRGFHIQTTYTHHQSYESEHIFLLLMVSSMLFIIKVVCL